MHLNLSIKTEFDGNLYLSIVPDCLYGLYCDKRGGFQTIPTTDSDLNRSLIPEIIDH